MRQTNIAMTAAFAFVLTSISACDAGLVHKASATRDGYAAALPMRAFLISSDQQASTSFKNYVSGGNPSTTLSAHYRSSGFATLADIFDTPPVAVSLSDKPFGDRSVKWYCPPGDEDPRVHVVAERIHHLCNSGNYAAAVRDAESSLREFPASCRLQIEWAWAAYWASVTGQIDSDATKQEQAIRGLITGAIEVVVTPEGISAAQTLRDVERFLVAIGDIRAARAVLLLARQCIERDSGTDGATDAPLARDIESELTRINSMTKAHS